MKTSIVISAFLGLLPAALGAYCSAPPPSSTSAAPSASSSAAAGPTGFYVIAARSASPIHLQEINANGEKFWIGKSTASYCPTGVVSECPAGTTTDFAGGQDTVSLFVEVPGGQQVYIAPDGSLSFTQAHSANIPAGSITTGFFKTEGEAYGTFGWSGGLVACPDPSGAWQIFGQISGFNSTNCLGFDGLTEDTAEVGAWQYT